MPRKEKPKEWYEQYRCSQCAKITPVTDRFTRVVDNAPILGFCSVKGFMVILEGKAERCFTK